MSDKFRRTFPIEIKFVDGELPPAPKLNALGRQARNGLSLTENALGDIWNQSGDPGLIPSSNLFANALYINNLARHLGPQNLLSPMVPALPDIANYSDTITHTGVGVSSKSTEGFTRYQPIVDPNSGGSPPTGITIEADTDSALTGTYRTDPSAIAAAGEWHLTAEGKLYTFTTFDTVRLRYDPIIVSDVSAEAVFNVIPDPSTTGGTSAAFFGLKITYSTDTLGDTKFWIYLPPRRPLDTSREIPSSPDETNNEISATNYFFQDPTADAEAVEHFRYKFNPVILDIIDTAISSGLSQTIPSNYLNLWDDTTGTIIEGLTFEADPLAPRYVVRVSGAKIEEIVNIDTAIDGSIISAKASREASRFKSRFRLSQPGTDLAVSTFNNRKKLHNHIHTGIDGTPRIKHSDLEGLSDINSPVWTASSLNGDDHPQYLHRDGFDPGAVRDLYKGGMRGHLVLLNSNIGTGNFFNQIADSVRLYFGDDTVSLHWAQSDDAIKLEGAQRFDIDATDAQLRLGVKTLGTQAGDELFLSHSGSQAGARLVTGKLTATSRTNEAAVSAGDERVDISAVAGSHGVVAAEGSSGARRLLLDGEDGVFIADSDTDFLYFPASDTSFETNVYLSRGRVKGLVAVLNQQKVYSTFWNYGGSKTSSSSTFIELGRVTVTLTDSLNYKIFITGWTNWSVATGIARIGLRTRLDPGVPSLVAHDNGHSNTSASGDVNSISISSAIFGGNVSGTFDVVLEFNRVNGSAELLAGTGELNVILAVDEAL